MAMWEWNNFETKQLMIETEQFMHGGGYRRRPTKVVGFVKITNKSRSASNATPLAYSTGFTNDARIFNTEAGHIFGLHIGGVNDSDNVVPMYAHVNRGTFRTVERDIEQNYQVGQNYGVEFTLTYGDVAEPRIPTSIAVKLVRNLNITGLGTYTGNVPPVYQTTVVQNPPVITRIAIDPHVQDYLRRMRDHVATSRWTLESEVGGINSWVEDHALPPVDRRPYAFLDYIYFKDPGNAFFPIQGDFAIGKHRGFTEEQRRCVALANRYLQTGAKQGECWSDAADDQITTALLDLGADSGIEIDHIMPETPVGCNAFSNAQVTSRKYNGSKNNTYT